MTWKTVTLPKLLKTPLINKKITGLTSPYIEDDNPVIGVGESLKISFKDSDDVIYARIKSSQLVQYQNLTSEMSMEAGYNSIDLFKHHLKEAFPDTISETYYIHYTLEEVTPAPSLFNKKVNKLFDNVKSVCEGVKP